MLVDEICAFPRVENRAAAAAAASGDRLKLLCGLQSRLIGAIGEVTWVRDLEPWLVASTLASVIVGVAG